MPHAFRLTFTFVGPYAHGVDGRGDPEWPPSPLRAFQALVAAAARLPAADAPAAAAALEWLERQPAPTVVAPPAVPAGRYLTYVPDNLHEYRDDRKRAEKAVAPALLTADPGAGTAVHYVYGPAEEFPHAAALAACANAVTHLGWGRDAVVGTAAVVDAAAAEAPAGATWVPVEHGPGRSRTPVDGTLAALAARHAAVLDRIGADGALTAVPALTPAAYQAVGYRRADDPAPRPWAAFRLDPTNPDGPPVARAPDVGLVELVQGVRGAAAAACAGWEFDEDATEAVTGHCPGTGEPTKTDKRFAYLPLPSLVPGRGGRLRVDLVRRVLVAGWAGFERQVAWLAPRLAGRPAGAGLILSPLAADDWVLGRYTATARAWASVVPVVLPGVPHRRGAAGAAVYRRAVALVAAALGQSGYPPALVAETEIDVSPAGFWPGLHRAKDYKRPDSIAHWTPAHVRLVFPRPVAGPLAVGAGRYVGFGVFAAE